jgi:hypothetical protein
MSSAFHPHTNGQAEAVNKMIGMYLRCMTGDGFHGQNISTIPLFILPWVTLLFVWCMVGIPLLFGLMRLVIFVLL